MNCSRFQKIHSAQPGYGLALILVMLFSMITVGTSMHMMLGGQTIPAMQTAMRNNFMADSVAGTAFYLTRNQIQTLLNAGTAVNAGYTWSSTVSLPDDPGNLAGTSSQVASFTSTVTQKGGNYYVIEIAVTLNGAKSKFTRFVPIAGTSYILDKVPGASLAYGLRKLRLGYTGSAIRVRRVSDNTEQDIGFTSSGDLDTTSLVSFLTNNNPTQLTGPPLDTVSGAMAAYGLRKLRTAYAGSAIQVRRSSDSTTQDIGFTASGDLDTTSLLNFVGSGTGYVAKWYDQSGNGRDAVQATATDQPVIVTSGVLETQNGRPAVYYSGTNSNMMLQWNGTTVSTTDVSAFMVANRFRGRSLWGVVAELEKTGGSCTQSVLADAHAALDSMDWTATWVSSDLNPSLTSHYEPSLPSSNGNNGTSLDQLSVVFDGSNEWFRVNGYADSARAASTNFIINYITLGRRANCDPTYARFYGKIAEIILYPSDQRTNASTIEYNQGYYYGIYNVGIGGHVKTWYDQSGNGKDLTQTTTTKQPGLVLYPEPGLAFDFKSGASSTNYKWMSNTALSISTNKMTWFTVALVDIEKHRSGPTYGGGESRMFSLVSTGATDDYGTASLAFFGTLNNGSCAGGQMGCGGEYNGIVHNPRSAHDGSYGNIQMDALFQATSVFDSANLTTRINGTAGSPQADSGTGTFNEIWVSGSVPSKQSGTRLWYGTMNEIILYPSNPTAYTTVESNQRTYFGTP